MCARSARRIVAAAVAAWALPGVVFAQELTGALIGSVKDAQGAAIPGATVRAASPSLIGGSAITTTNERGQWRLAALPVGDYILTVELSPFRPYHEPDIRVGAGTTIERSIVLTRTGMAESLVVRGSGSRIDARDPGVGTRVDRQELLLVPSRRFSMIDAIRSAPGTSATSPSSGAINSVSIFGSGTNENSFLIDGTNFTCPCSGEARSEPGVDFIQEVQIRGVGASAEFGNAQGAVINVLTRQGGDRFQFDAAYYAQTAALTGRTVRLPYPGGLETSAYARAKYRDVTANAGGPAWRNRLWFFGGYQHLRDHDSQPGTNPALPRTYEQDKFFGKLTWRLGPGLQLVQSVHTEQWVNPELPTHVRPFEATQRLHASVPAITFGHLTHTVSARTVWDLRAGRFVYSRVDDPSSGDVNVPSRIDRVTAMMTGAPQTFGGLKLIRTTVKGVVDHYRTGWLSADHHWRAGGQLERGEHRLSTIVPTGTRYIDQAGKPFRAESSPPSIVGGVFVTASGFVSHGVTIGPSLTINAGVRFDHSRAISQDLPALEADGRESGGTINGLGRMYTWNVWSPRLGMTVRLTPDGRTMLRASYGRFQQGVLTGELAPFHPGATSVTTAEYDPATAAYSRIISVVDPRRNLQFDPRTAPPRTDAWSAGLDREVGRFISLAIAVVHKRGANFIGWTDVGGQYRENVHALPDGRSLTTFALAGPAADRRFLLTNPAGYAMRYNGLVLAATRRRANGWQANASYTWSAATGLQASGGSSAAASQVSTISSARFLTFGQDPNSLTNAFGRLPNDRPHVLRVMASADIPRTGLAVAANVQHLSGKPWAATALVPLPQGDVRIQLERRGARRLSSQTLVDFRLSRAVTAGGAARIELILDVLNLFNERAEEALATDNLFSSTFAQPAAFVDPRRGMLSCRFMWGR
jgi:hypothetical protein